MSTLIQQALVIDPTSPHNGKKRDLLIERGKIISIAARIESETNRRISAPGLCVSPGWIDLKANFCEPGYEFKETLLSGAEAARRGGFRHVVVMPSVKPTVDHKSGIEFVLARSGKSDLRLWPCGALSDKMEGRQLSEMFDMHAAGAIGFTDDKHHVGTELMSRAIEYASNFDGLIMSMPFEPSIAQHGQMHEGSVSVALGMKGIPALSEEMRVQRDIELLRYHGGRLHFMLISTARSVELIRKAKKEGLNVSCAVAAHQLSFLDEDLVGFDSNFKVLPPFRTREDRKALIAGLKDGTIDAICSDHSPEDIEHKVREFEDAEFGISGIQTAFSSAFTALEKHLSTEEIIAKFTSGPARVLRLPASSVSENSPADITVFSTDEDTTFDKSSWKSLSYNSPFIGKTLRGKVYA